jgi:energy-coupling factor transport system permease protein
MRLLTPIVPNAASPLGRANPVAKLLAALVLLVALFASLDAVTAGIVLAVLVALLPASGLPARVLVGRAWPIGALAIAVGLFNVLFAAEQLGPIVIMAGPVRIGTETLMNGGGLVLRLIAVALAGLLATATSDPTEVADALIQQAHVSPRFAVGALAALRLLPLLARESQVIGMARRARGVDAGRSPVAAVQLAGGAILGLLVSAIRRGARMARAMEARGFGARPCRTVARPQRMRLADWGWVLGALVVAAAAIGASVALGTWRPLLG